MSVLYCTLVARSLTFPFYQGFNEMCTKFNTCMVLLSHLILLLLINLLKGTCDDAGLVEANYFSKISHATNFLSNGAVVWNNLKKPAVSSLLTASQVF